MKNYIKIFLKKEENNNKTIKRHIIKKICERILDKNIVYNQNIIEILCNEICLFETNLDSIENMKTDLFLKRTKLLYNI